MLGWLRRFTAVQPQEALFTSDLSFWFITCLPLDQLCSAWRQLSKEFVVSMEDSQKLTDLQAAQEGDLPEQVLHQLPN